MATKTKKPSDEKKDDRKGMTWRVSPANWTVVQQARISYQGGVTSQEMMDRAMNEFLIRHKLGSLKLDDNT